MAARQKQQRVSCFKKGMQTIASDSERCRERNVKTRNVWILTGMLFLTAYGLWRFRIFLIMSGSMAPELPVGSIIIVDTLRADVETGDIISFRLSSENIVTHRITGCSSDGWITKGDANEDVDIVQVKQENIIGVVVITIPHPFRTFCYLFVIMAGLESILKIKRRRTT